MIDRATGDNIAAFAWLAGSAFRRPAAASAAGRAADHAQMRALLTPFFLARRMQDLRPRVEALVDQLLEALGQQTPPVDLHEALSFPLPVLVICELLGVPYEDREQFRRVQEAELRE